MGSQNFCPNLWRIESHFSMDVTESSTSVCCIDGVMMWKWLGIKTAAYASGKCCKISFHVCCAINGSMNGVWPKRVRAPVWKISGSVLWFMKRLLQRMCQVSSMGVAVSCSLVEISQNAKFTPMYLCVKGVKFRFLRNFYQPPHCFLNGGRLRKCAAAGACEAWVPADVLIVVCADIRPPWPDFGLHGRENLGLPLTTEVACVWRRSTVELTPEPLVGENGSLSWALTSTHANIRVITIRLFL